MGARTALTYRELEERSNQLAHLLRQRGVKKGDRVGIFFPKCVESRGRACSAVLKAGGVYVPLDPQAPAERVGYIIGNCGIRVLLTSKERRAVLAPDMVESLRLLRDDRRARLEWRGAKVVPWAMLREYPASSAPAK